MSPIVGLKVTFVKSSEKCVVINTVRCHTAVQFITTFFFRTFNNCNISYAQVPAPSRRSQTETCSGILVLSKTNK
jgi:hypothetical protein